MRRGMNLRDCTEEEDGSDANGQQNLTIHSGRVGHRMPAYVNPHRSIHRRHHQVRSQRPHPLFCGVYRQSIATALGGEVRDQSKAKNVYVGPGIMTVEHLQCHDDDVFDAIAQFLQKFRELE